MDKIQSREWDSGKPAGDWKKPQTRPPASSQPGDGNEATANNMSVSNTPPQESGGWTRGGSARGGSTRGRGRGKGKGTASTGREDVAAPEERSTEPDQQSPSIPLKVANPEPSHETPP
jgi:hypothetical protein